MKYAAVLTEDPPIPPRFGRSGANREPIFHAADAPKRGEMELAHIERFSLIDRIGRELQSRMRYADISAYLAKFGVDTSKETSGVNSKWVYTKELLADAPSEAVLRIADELGIPHGYTVTPSRGIAESQFWEPNYFRLFLSHLSSFKRTAGGLQRSLRRFGISAFVAHVDIEPTREWQDEIEAALYSMDALAAILMPGFKDSDWTDQELGVAIGRGVFAYSEACRSAFRLMSIRIPIDADHCSGLKPIKKTAVPER